MKIIFLYVTLMMAFASSQAVSSQKDAFMGTTTIIKAVLTQKIISDYPGDFRCYVTHDVYDSSYEYILIPKGSVCHGQVVKVSNVNEPISARVGYIIKSITRPDNTIIDLSRDTAVDHEGVAGIEDQVDKHILAQFMGVVAYALIGAENTGAKTGGITGDYDYEAEVKRNTLDQFQPLATKYLKLVPTVTIRSGQTFNIFIVAPKKITPFRSVFDDFYG